MPIGPIRLRRGCGFLLGRGRYIGYFLIRHFLIFIRNFLFLLGFFLIFIRNFLFLLGFFLIEFLQRKHRRTHPRGNRCLYG